MTSAERRRKLLNVIEEAFADAGVPHQTREFLNDIAYRIEALFERGRGLNE